MLAKCGVKNCLKKLSSLQDKAIRIINFEQQDFPVNAQCNVSEILKIKDYIHLINFLFVKDVLSNESLEAFSNCFTKSDEFHDHMTQHSPWHSIIMKHSNTQSYLSFSIRNKAASSWNFLQSKLNTDVTFESHNKAKKILKSYFIRSVKPEHNLLTTKANKVQI